MFNIGGILEIDIAMDVTAHTVKRVLKSVILCIIDPWAGV